MRSIRRCTFMCVARLMRGLSFRTIETVATETFACLATSRRLTGFGPGSERRTPRRRWLVAAAAADKEPSIELVAAAVDSADVSVSLLMGTARARLDTLGL